jgi:hypothetical protein
MRTHRKVRWHRTRTTAVWAVLAGYVVTVAALSVSLSSSHEDASYRQPSITLLQENP